MKQSEIFLQGEGDAYYERNKDKPHLPDPVLEAIERLSVKPTTVLEIGCGTGWRLKEIEDKYGSFCVGCDPSAEAVNNRVHEGVWQETAQDMWKIGDDLYDLIIFGFCLYLIDREELMNIAAHTDRILKDGGYIIIHDFRTYPHSVPYKHHPEIKTYKYDYAKLWTGNPAYRFVDGNFYGAAKDNIYVSVLKKDLGSAWPMRDK